MMLIWLLSDYIYTKINVTENKEPACSMGHLHANPERQRSYALQNLATESAYWHIHPYHK